MIQFSIVIPLYNKSAYIKKTLDSIKNQSYENYEVLIVNDGSTDNSKEVVESLNLDSRFKLLDKPNGGAATARNYGVAHALYDYIAFLDADDYWEANHLANLATLIESYSDKVDLFASGFKEFINGEFFYPKLAGYQNHVGVIDFFRSLRVGGNFINSSNVCVKKEAIKQSPFPVDMQFEDIITWARVANNKGFAFSSEYTAVYVRDNSELSHRVEFESCLKYSRLLKKIDYSNRVIKLYAYRICLLHILHARMSLGFGDYINESKKIFGKDLMLSLFIVAGVLTPRSLLRALKEAKK